MTWTFLDRSLLKFLSTIICTITVMLFTRNRITEWEFKEIYFSKRSKANTQNASRRHKKARGNGSPNKPGAKIYRPKKGGNWVGLRINTEGENLLGGRNMNGVLCVLISPARDGRSSPTGDVWGIGPVENTGQAYARAHTGGRKTKKQVVLQSTKNMNENDTGVASVPPDVRAMLKGGTRITSLN